MLMATCSLEKKTRGGREENFSFSALNIMYTHFHGAANSIRVGKCNYAIQRIIYYYYYSRDICKWNATEVVHRGRSYFSNKTIIIHYDDLWFLIIIIRILRVCVGGGWLCWSVETHMAHINGIAKGDNLKLKLNRSRVAREWGEKHPSIEPRSYRLLAFAALSSWNISWFMIYISRFSDYRDKWHAVARRPVAMSDDLGAPLFRVKKRHSRRYE